MRGTPIVKSFSQIDSLRGNLNQGANLREIPSTDRPVDPVELPMPGLLAAPFGIIVIIWIAIFLRRSSSLKAAHRPPVTYSLRQKVPCSTCRFLSSNPYLKCAVHPSKVLRKEAIDCSDYWAKDSDKFSC